MKKILGIFFIFTSAWGNAFDNGCTYLLKNDDDRGVLNKALSKDIADAPMFFINPHDKTVQSPTNCQAPKTNYEKIVCSDSSLIKLDKIAHMTYIQNYINATGETLSPNEMYESGYNNKWINRVVADKESVCLKLMYMDGVDTKLGR